MAGGLYWQFYLIMEKDSNYWWGIFDGDFIFADESPKRVMISFFAGIIIILGIITYILVASFDAQKNLSQDVFPLLPIILKSFVFFMFLLIKSYFGPFFLSFSLCSIIYTGIEYGDFSHVAFISSLLDWVFAFAPEPTSSIYLFTSSLVILGSSILDTTH